jgi:hypothetical protein
MAALGTDDALAAMLEVETLRSAGGLDREPDKGRYFLVRAPAQSLTQASK